MKQSDIDKFTSFVMSKFQGYRPGQIVREMAITDAIRKQHPFEYHKGINVYLMLILGGYIERKDRIFVALTESGYRLIEGSEPLVLQVNFLEMFDLKKSRDYIFYDLWEFIGEDPKGDVNPFYISGSDFYKIIKDGMLSLPPTYTQYVESLPLKLNGMKQTRSEWYKTLFLQLEDEQLVDFLNIVSDHVNKKLMTAVSGLQVESDITVDEIQSIQNFSNNNPLTDCKMSQKIKIFISHKQEDGNYAKAIIDMLRALGVAFEDIFCSSYPGCGVPYGKGILNTIRDQFDEYSLFVIFIHSPRYYSSPVCLNEMGASWILRTDHRSFMTHDCGFNMLQGVVKADDTIFQAGQKNTYHLLHDFRRTIESAFGLKPIHDAIWETTKNDFLKTVVSFEYPSK